TPSGAVLVEDVLRVAMPQWFALCAANAAAIAASVVVPAGTPKPGSNAGREVGEVADEVEAADVRLAIGADCEPPFDVAIAALPDLHALHACLIVLAGVGADRKGLHVDRLGEIAGIAQRVAAGKDRVVVLRRGAEQVTGHPA